MSVMAVAHNVIVSNFGEYRAPDWIVDVPMRLCQFTNDDGDLVDVQDIDSRTPEGAAFWRWMSEVVEARSRAAWERNEERDYNMFTNEPRPF